MRGKARPDRDSMVSIFSYLSVTKRNKFVLRSCRDHGALSHSIGKPFSISGRSTGPRFGIPSALMVSMGSRTGLEHTPRAVSNYKDAIFIGLFMFEWMINSANTTSIHPAKQVHRKRVGESRYL